MLLKKLIILFAVLLIPGFIHAANENNLPGSSIYNVESQWVDQANTPYAIIDLQGRVQVVAFVYTYCKHSCPFIVANLKQIQASIPDEYSDEVQFSLISLDPTRDTPQVLSRYMREHDLESPLWQMLNGNPDDVLELAALLGVRYQPMDQEGTDIAHSNMISVLDKKGRILFQLKGLNENLDSVVGSIVNELRATN